LVVWSAFHDRALTPAERDVLLVLAGYAVTGVAWPSHATLAERTRRHVKTVARALAVARRLGLVDWHEGGRWIENGRWKRRSNRYRLIIPAVKVAVGDRGLRRHLAKGMGFKVKKEAPRTAAEQIAALGVVVPRGSGSPAFREAMGW